MKILELRERSKYKVFTRVLRRFAKATPTEESMLQIEKDIDNILEARASVQRLESLKIVDRSDMSVRM